MKLIYLFLFSTVLLSCGGHEFEEKKMAKYLNSEIEFTIDDIYRLESELNVSNSIEKYSGFSKQISLSTLNYKLKSIQNEVNKRDYSTSKIDSLLKDPMLKLQHSTFFESFPIEPFKNWSDSLNQKIKNLSFLRFKKMILNKIIGSQVGYAAINDLQVHSFNSNNTEFVIFGLLDSVAANNNQINIKTAFIGDSSQQVKTKVTDKGFYSEIEFLTDKNGLIKWEGNYQVQAVNGKLFYIPIDGSFEKK
jgi:hypothetical protein